MAVESILFAEDGERARSFAAALEREGYHCTRYASDARVELEGRPIVFIDLALGTATACALARRMLADVGPVAPLIAVFGEPNASEIDELIAAGVNIQYDSASLERRTRFLRSAVQARAHLRVLVEKLRASEELNRHLQREHLASLEGSHDALAIYRNGRIVWANRRLAELKGCAGREELIGKPMIDLVSPRYRELVAQRIQMVAAGAALPPFEYDLLHIDGTEVPVSAISMPWIFENEPARIVFIHDLTEQRRLESELAAADRLASLGRLAASVGHEINNPLAYVIGNLELALRKLQHGGSAADLTDMLSEALQGAERVGRIAADLKVFSMRGRERDDRADVRDVLQSCVRMTSGELRQRAHLVEDIADVPPVRIGAPRLAQIVTNLLVNAAQAIPEGQHGTITLSARAAGDAVELRVADTGVGIPAEHLPHVLEPFFSTKRGRGGLGLGLSICHTLVSTHGGELTLASEAGRGTTVTVRLPRAEGETPSVIPPPAVVAAGRRVLLVDDELRLAQILRDQLSPHDVTIATSGAQALAMIDERDFDVVVCDLMMPDVGGIEVYERVRDRRPGLEGRMVFVTGGAFTQRAASFLANLPNRCLEKPFQIEALLSAIEAAAAL